MKYRESQMLNVLQGVSVFNIKFGAQDKLMRPIVIEGHKAKKTRSLAPLFNISSAPSGNIHACQETEVYIK